MLAIAHPSPRTRARTGHSVLGIAYRLERWMGLSMKLVYPTSLRVISLTREGKASSSSENEKGWTSADVVMASVDQTEYGGDELTGTLRTINTDDPFPIDPHSPVEVRQFTLRAVLFGSDLGAVVSASDVYLGLKVRPSYSIFDLPRLDVPNSIRPGGPLAHPSLASPFSDPLDFRDERSRRRLLWPQRKQRRPSRRERRWLPRTALHHGLFRRHLPTRSPQRHPQPIHWPPSSPLRSAVPFPDSPSQSPRNIYILKTKFVFLSGVAAAHTIRSLHVGKSAARDAKYKTKPLFLIGTCFIRRVRIGWTSPNKAERWVGVPLCLSSGFLTDGTRGCFETGGCRRSSSVRASWPCIVLWTDLEYVLGRIF